MIGNEKQSSLLQKLMEQHVFKIAIYYREHHYHN